MSKKKKAKKKRCRRCNRSCNGDFCSKDCEIKFLKSQLSTADKKLERQSAPRKPQCLGRVEWETCVQEWYLKETYDAKRRACELRHKGFGCSAKSVGEMPLEDGNGEIRLAKVTILTAHYRENEKGELLVPPEPAEIVEGLVVEE